MRSVKSRNTKPEMIVRRFLHRPGYRYRLHKAELPGKPDIVFSSRKKVIFIHGCFWHGHSCKRGNREPKSNADYWRAKIKRNIERYTQQLGELSDMGWKELTLWECELADKDSLERKLKSFLLQAR